MRHGCRPLIEDKWSLLVVSMLGAGPRRFTELKRGLAGISQRMLTVTLRNLERDGIIVRSVLEVMPPHVDYRLTDRGARLLEAVQPVIAWGRENVAAVEESRAAYDAGDQRPSRREHDAAEDLPGVHPVVRAGRFGEREHVVDDRV
jgi:DNA-binding HxlR family transcriptional regulator